MDRERVRTEALILENSYPSVTYELEKGYVMITRFDYPDGWEPGTAPLFFSLPANYPRQRPDMYIPPEMRYHGETAWAQHDRNDDGWWKWCIPQMDWRPDDHTLRTMVDLMRTSLADPNERDPYWRSVEKRRRQNFQDRIDEIVGSERGGDPGGEDDGIDLF